MLATIFFVVVMVILGAVLFEPADWGSLKEDNPTFCLEKEFTNGNQKGYQ